MLFTDFFSFMLFMLFVLFRQEEVWRRGGGKNGVFFIYPISLPSPSILSTCCQANATCCDAGLVLNMFTGYTEGGLWTM